MTVRWGFIGAGYVASRAMAPAVHAADGAVLHGVASREVERSQALEPVRVHTTYEDLLADPQIDVVYISLRNGQHAQWVTRALETGHHVLCEKPLALDAAEARVMFDTAEATDRLLVEAVWMRWHPRFQRMLDVIAQGALGELVSIDSAFTFTGDQMEGNYRLDPSQGGGALLDVGCYQTHVWLAAMGHHSMQPVHVTIDSVGRDVGPTGVDLTTTVRAQLTRGGDSSTVVGDQVSSFALPARQHLEVRGQQATMRIGEGEAFTAWNVASSLLIGGHEEWFAPVDPFRLMVESVSSRVAGRGEAHDDRVPRDDSLRVAEILDLIHTAPTN